MYNSRRLCVHRDAKSTTRKVRGVCRLLEFREDRSKRSGRKFVEHARPVVTIALSWKQPCAICRAAKFVSHGFQWKCSTEDAIRARRIYFFHKIFSCRAMKSGRMRTSFNVWATQGADISAHRWPSMWGQYST